MSSSTTVPRGQRYLLAILTVRALRTEWINAPEAEAQKKIAMELQRQALMDLPYVPLGTDVPANVVSR